MIELGGLSFGYDGREVLEGLTLSVAAGDRLAIVGANGAGKTTLLRLIAGLIEPDSGTVDVDGTVGFAPEDPETGLFAASVREEVAFFPRNLGMAVEPAVAAALAAMDLDDLGDRNPFSLSVGEQRRVSIAAVVSGDPAVIALDEPTKGLDRRGARALAASLRDSDATLVFSTHDTDFAYELADRTALLGAGGFVARGPPREVLGDVEMLSEAGVRPPGLVEVARREGLDRLPETFDEAVAMLRGDG